MIGDSPSNPIIIGDDLSVVRQVQDRIRRLDRQHAMSRRSSTPRGEATVMNLDQAESRGQPAPCPVCSAE
jgi:hypothetical protein